MAYSGGVAAVVTAMTRATEGVCRALALEILANLVETTPVRTGWARSNWVAAVGEPPEDPFGTPKAVSNAAQEAGKAAVLGYRLGQGSISVVNNVPYIGRLNDGYSAQAPAGFVELAILRAQNEVAGL